MAASQSKSSHMVCNELIKQALEYSRLLIILADEGEAHSNDDGCAVLYGVIRDCAYRIRAEAERERQLRRSASIWDIGSTG